MENNHNQLTRLDPGTYSCLSIGKKGLSTFARKFEEGMENKTAAADALTTGWIA